MTLSDIVDVVITRQTQSVTEKSFGTPLILGTNVDYTDLIRFYGSMDEVAVDFSSDTKEYIAAQDIFAQDISPNRIAIGRRNVNNVDVEVITGMTGINYTITINDVDYTVNSTSSETYSKVTLDSDLVTENRVYVTVTNPSTPAQKTGVGTIKSEITFDIDFVAGQVINITLFDTASVAVGPVTAAASNNATLDLLVTALKAKTALVFNAFPIYAQKRIVVIFKAPAYGHTGIKYDVISAITTPLAAEPVPVATIVSGGFLFNTDTRTTMLEIANQLMGQFPEVDYAIVDQANGRIMHVVGKQGSQNLINTFVVNGGATQAIATITTPKKQASKDEIAKLLVTSINSNTNAPVIADSTVENIINLVKKVGQPPYSVKLKTNITNPNAARVIVTQILPETDYTVTLNGVKYTYTTPLNIFSANKVVNELVKLINKNPKKVNVVATSNGNGSFEIASELGLTTFSISTTPEIMSSVKGLYMLPLVASGTSVADDLTAINNENSEWYALISLDRNKTIVKAIADWTETQMKLFGTASDDVDIINLASGTDSSSIAAILQQAGYLRTFVMYHQDAAFDYPEAAWFGKVLPLEPGSETWKFKTLNSISYTDITTNQQNNVLSKNANTYEYVAGVGITQEGTVAQGEYIDIIRGIDWLTSRIQEYVFSVLVNNPKIPFTDAGIACIEAEVKRVLQIGVGNDFLANDPAPKTYVPKAIDVPQQDKANRLLKNVKFTATLAGAIHFVQIRGTVSV